MPEEHSASGDQLFEELFAAYHRSVHRLFEAVASDIRSPYIRFLRGLDASLTRVSTLSEDEAKDGAFNDKYVVVLRETESAIAGLDGIATKDIVQIQSDFEQRLTMALRKQPPQLILPCTSEQYQSRVQGVVPAVSRILGGIGFALRSVFDRKKPTTGPAFTRSFAPQQPFDDAIRDVVLRALSVYIADMAGQYATRMVDIAQSASRLASPVDARRLREEVQQCINWLMHSPQKGQDLFNALFSNKRQLVYESWQAAGTLAQGPKIYLSARNAMRRFSTARLFKRAQKHVDTYGNTTAGVWRHSTGMCIVQVHSEVAYVHSRAWLTSALEKNVASSLRHFRTFLSELRESTLQSRGKIQSRVLESRATEHVVKLVAAINTLTPDRIIEEFVDDTKQSIGRLPAKVTVFKVVSKEEVKHPTGYPLRSLLSLEANAALEPLTRLPDLWNAERGVSITEVNDIPSVLEFLMNMYEGQEESENADEKESTHKAVVDGLARVDSLLDRIEKRLEFGTFLDALTTSRNEIHTLADHYSKVETLQQAYLRKLMLDARGVFKLLLKWGYKGVRIGLEKAVDLIRKLPSLFSSRYSQVKKLAGLQDQGSQVTPAIVNFRASVAQHVAALPAMYVKLFSEANEDDTRFYVTDEAMMASLQEALTIHRQGFLSNCAIIGSPGSGRSSAVWAFFEQHTTDNMFSIELRAGDDEISMSERLSDAMGVGTCSSWQQLQDMLMTLDESPVCFIENIHVLYKRVATDRQIVQGLIHLFSATVNTVTWVITINTEMWQYLDRTMNFSALFYKEIHLDNRPSQFVRKTIERRHRVSGFKLDFVDRNPRAAWWNLSKSLTPQQRADLFYDELTSLSNGNVGIAHQLWLRSVVSASTDEFRVEIASLPKGTLISQLTLREKFVLHTVMIHEFVDASLVAQVLRISETHAQDTLSRLFASGLLVAANNDQVGWYSISRQFYGVVRNVLKAANMVH